MKSDVRGWSELVPPKAARWEKSEGASDRVIERERESTIGFEGFPIRWKVGLFDINEGAHLCQFNEQRGVRGWGRELGWVKLFWERVLRFFELFWFQIWKKKGGQTFLGLNGSFSSWWGVKFLSHWIKRKAENLRLHPSNPTLSLYTRSRSQAILKSIAWCNTSSEK